MTKIEFWFVNLQKIPATAKIFLLQNLGVMIRAGLPLGEALNTIADQTKSPKLKNILLDTKEKITAGKSFAEALTPYAKDFGEIFINMIAAGEASGSLEGVLNGLYIQSKKDHTLKTKIRNAMTYPVIIVCAMLGIGALVIFFVLPNITSMFKDLNVDLPLPTKILIGISNFAQNDGLIFFPALIIFIFLFLRWTRTSFGRPIWHQILLKTPIAGDIIKKVNIARLALNLSNLIQTDIAIPEALKITANTLNNELYKRALLEAAEKVKKGKKIADIFKEYSNIMSPIVIQMISVGEETGALDVVLKNMADFYQEEVEQTMENLPVIIEPILMLMMGAAVGGLAIAVILPIYSLTQAF